MAGSTMTPAAILQRAATFVDQGHTKAWEARDKDGLPCEFDDARAVAWDACGAVAKAAGYDEADGMHPKGRANFLGTDAFFAYSALLAGITGVSPRDVEDRAGAEIIDAIGRWNDALDRTQSEVVAALRRAAVLASARALEIADAAHVERLRAQRRGEGQVA